VTAPGGRTLLVVSSLPRDGHNLARAIPAAVLKRAGASPGVLRFIGGASITSKANKTAMLRFAEMACRNMTPGTLLMSAGNRIVQTPPGMTIVEAEDQLVVDPMVMELPSVVRRGNPSCFTLGVVPRVTETMAVYGKYSALAFDSNASIIVNPTYDLMWVVQQDNVELDWDGDVLITCMLIVAMQGEGKPAATIAWNGGRITALEIRQALLDNMPLGVARRSGGFSDDIIAWREDRRANVSPQGVAILQSWENDAEAPDITDFTILESPQQAHAWLVSLGLAS
jgi:hypothetical protein